MTLNIDKIMAHRGLILTALKVFRKAVDKVIKGEEEIEADTDDTERKIAILDELEVLFKDQRSLLLEGTPMGDALTDEKYRAPDGASLRAGPIDDELRLVDIDAPMEAITGWTLEQRKEVHEWAKAALIAKEHGLTAPLGDLISETWRCDVDSLLEREMSEEEIAKWIARGPFFVRMEPDKSPGLAEWEVYRTVEGVEQVREQRWAALDRARLIAANLNAIEEGQQATLRANAKSTPDADTSDGNSSTGDVTAPEGEAPAKRRRRKKGEPETASQVAVDIVKSADAEEYGGDGSAAAEDLMGTQGDDDDKVAGSIKPGEDDPTKWLDGTEKPNKGKSKKAPDITMGGIAQP